MIIPPKFLKHANIKDFRLFSQKEACRGLVNSAGAIVLILKMG